MTDTEQTKCDRATVRRGGLLMRGALLEILRWLVAIGAAALILAVGAFILAYMDGVL